MRILLITNLFHPEPNYLKGLEFAKELRRRGHDVHVLTGFPSYPGGKVYPGYRMRWTVHEAIDGVQVTRVAAYPSHDRSAVRRALSYVTVGLSQALHGLGPLGAGRFDVCHVYLGPITLMWPAALLRWARGTGIVGDVQDIWPESVNDSGMLRSRIGRSLLDRWCRWAYRQPDRLVVLSDGYRRALSERGLDPRRIEVVHNWCDEASLLPDEKAQGGVLRAGAFNVLYAGNFGRLQGLDTILDAAKLLSGSRIHFSLVGDGVEGERLRSRAQEEGIDNVAFHARLPLRQVNALQKAADLLLVHLEPTALTRMGIPSKIQSYLACGTPLLVAAEGDAAELAARSGGAFTCPPNAPEDLADEVRRAASLRPADLDAMGARARDFYWKELSFVRGVDRVEAVLREAAIGSDSRRTPDRRRWPRLQRFAKRAVDVAVSLLALVCLGPLIAVVAIAIRIRMGAPVLFVQERPGLHGLPFRLLKFRTMRDGEGPDADRLTPLGRFLRSTSLDELPQLWNVLRGELSLVGPRPLLMRYLPRYTPEQARRHEVKPGITGWAQVNGRNAITWEEKFALDVWYVDNWSLALDLKILWMTLGRVFRRSGIAAQGEATMSEFRGSSSRKEEP